MTFYHGSNAAFETFLEGTGDGIYFSTNRDYAEGYATIKSETLGGEKQIYAAHLTLLSPLELNGEDKAVWEKYTNRGFDRRHLEAEGYDGILMKYADGEIEAMVFKSSQIELIKNTSRMKQSSS